MSRMWRNATNLCTTALPFKCAAVVNFIQRGNEIHDQAGEERDGNTNTSDFHFITVHQAGLSFSTIHNSFICLTVRNKMLKSMLLWKNNQRQGGLHGGDPASGTFWGLFTLIRIWFNCLIHEPNLLNRLWEFQGRLQFPRDFSVKAEMLLTGDPGSGAFWGFFTVLRIGFVHLIYESTLWNRFCWVQDRF